jgi:hypothetical protein
VLLIAQNKQGDIHMAERIDLEIAQVLGQPIDPNLKVAVALSEIANLETAQPGELVRIFNNSAEDTNDDDVYAVDANGGLTLHKVTPVAPATLTFVGLQSKLEYVLIDEILPAADQNALARKKAAITRAMDKEELRRICTAMLGLTTQEVDAASGEDLYDVILKMKHKLEDYGDNYILLAGSTVTEKIDTYDKDKVSTFEYRIGLKETLAQLGIKVVKVIGKVNGVAVLAATKAIMVARDSSLAQGKPVTFVRRMINPAIAAQMGVEAGERLVSVAQVPTIINADNKNTLGYGVFGYESIIETITNYRAIAWSDSMGL